MTQLEALFSVVQYEQLDLNLERVEMGSSTQKEPTIFLSAAQVTYHKFIALVKCGGGFICV